jgi:hypothetical protein
VHDLLVPIFSVAGSFAGAWIAAKLALSNYYRQQIWERKAEAYNTIFESIHGFEQWHRKHFEALVRGTNVNDELREKLWAEANKAEDDFEKCLDGRVWILPTAFSKRAWAMSFDLKQEAYKHASSWDDYLSASLTIIGDTKSELKKIAQTDLRIN